ncbi:MAG: glutamine-hydrolyzing GMP synthase [Nisaea sp.]|nr:glutamine-hydrolyzing GMP synthase [Nisaea sp.]|tara:strand:- start:8760 stop:10472 length:1713 start_codon:yes stop_codon:yes gene_type:complete
MVKNKESDINSNHDKQGDNPEEESRRLTASDDLEISTYLEIAEEKRGKDPLVSSQKRLHRESIIIVDFGSQYSRLIARRVRENQVYSEIVSHDTDWETVESLQPKGVILSGGPASVYDDGAPLAPSWVFDKGLPVLGICYGMQVIAHQLGGTVASSQKREYGHSVVYQDTKSDPLFSEISQSMPVWMSHGDKINQLPPGFKSIGYSDNSPVAVFVGDEARYGIQFHPEVVHTPEGQQLIKNFLFKVCGVKGLWTSSNFAARAIKDIKAKVGGGKVVCALSGGVDSSVAATLVHQAIGDQLTCIFVNNGLLRKEESDRILSTFKRHLKVNLIYKDATDEFLGALENVSDPEKKRKIIGEQFIKLFEKEAKKLGDADYLCQGTLYPDVIESETDESKVSVKIKTHHNVGGLPKHMQLKLIEPLRYLFKDEVRKVGLELGLSKELVNRQPFPGPGLAIRVIGTVTKEKLDILREADWVVMDEIKRNNLYESLWQSFAVLTDTKSVGVVGDHRLYGYTIAIRAVTSDDAMTADWARLPYEVLSTISNRISNEVNGVSRVVYDITSKPPGTIEWE